MISTYIASQIYANFVYAPTSEQKKLINLASEYIASARQGVILIVNGYAGTGKTSVIGALVKSLKAMQIQVVLLAPTGRAAKVMSLYCENAAFTIHKKIYRQKKIAATGAQFDLNINQHNNTVFIVDEASMLSNSSAEASVFGSGQLLADLIQYINMGDDNRLIIVGDDAQLPPVGLDFSPALNPLDMERFAEVEYATLTEVVRQAEDSGILLNATHVREDIEAQRVCLPRFDLSIRDVQRLTGAELIEQIEDSYARYGEDNTVIITRSNKRANQYNQGIRRTILDHEEEICSGDRIMVVKNNYYYTENDKTTALDFIANGDVATVEKIYRTREIYGFRYAWARLRFADYDDYTLECWVMLDTLTSEAPSLTRDQQTRLFYTIEQDYVDIKNKRNRYQKVMENEFFNALQVKFAYAITCHKSQGGQWDVVLLDQMLFGEEPITRDFQRWLYTAVTRATKQLFLVNWHDRFFEDAPSVRQ